jgi:hypothetical protein
MPCAAGRAALLVAMLSTPAVAGTLRGTFSDRMGLPWLASRWEKGLPASSLVPGAGFA